MALNPQNVTPGTEQHEYFYVRQGRRSLQRCQYDYRHTDGELFSCIKPTLQDCVDARDEWLSKTGR